MFDCAFYIATEAEAKEMAAEMAHPENAVEAGGLTDLDISNVFAIAAGEAFEFDRHELTAVVEEQDYSLYQLPARLLALLATASEADVQGWAEEWSKAEEFGFDDDEFFAEEDDDGEFVAQLAEVVASLAALARRAAGQDVFMMVYTDWLPSEEEIEEYERELGLN
ncbi:MAG: hypothetical protein Q4G28_06275 [Neisseria sp.]|nr:hypothetical protein [Neisseria sp.]